MKRLEEPETTFPQKTRRISNAVPSVKQSRDVRRLRVNMTIQGELADWVTRWQERGLVRSVSDAVRQSLIALREKFQTMDERAIRLQTISQSDEDSET